MTKVMLVEDNPILLESIAFELEMRGYEVMQAVDGRAALDLLNVSEDVPDIIVSDIAMPNMDGYALLESVRQNQKWNDVPFLFLTALDSKNASRTGRELGVDDYLTKPFQPDELVVAMESKIKRIAQFRQVAELHMEDVRRELLYMLSQELRSPLTYIFGGTEMLEEYIGPTEDETVQEMLGLVQLGVKRLNRFINNVLYLVTIDSGHLKRLIEQYAGDFEIMEMVRIAINTIRENPLFAASEIQVEVNGLEEEVYVHGLDEYLIMMVAEILHNAFKYSLYQATVTVDVQHVDDEVQITIHNDGPMIPEDKLEHVWDRFMQFHHEDYEQQGSGLGLALVRESAILHGGDCSIESDMSSGTTVTLRLPVTAPGDDIET